MTKAVLFDAAGTLFRVRGSVGEVYAAAAAWHGITIVPRQIEARFQDAFGAMPPLAFPQATPDELPRCEYDWWRQLVATAFEGVRFKDFEAVFRDLFDYFADASAWELFPDAEPALSALRARGMRLGLVSNFDGRLVPICKGLGIADRFEVIVMSARAGVAKPDPRIFTDALQRLGVDPADAIHVGDSEREDFEGARAAGLRALLIRRAGVAGAAGPLPDTLSDLQQLVHYV